MHHFVSESGAKRQPGSHRSGLGPLVQLQWPHWDSPAQMHLNFTVSRKPEPGPARPHPTRKSVGSCGRRRRLSPPPRCERHRHCAQRYSRQSAAGSATTLIMMFILLTPSFLVSVKIREGTNTVISGVTTSKNVSAVATYVFPVIFSQALINGVHLSPYIIPITYNWGSHSH